VSDPRRPWLNDAQRQTLDSEIERVKKVGSTIFDWLTSPSDEAFVEDFDKKNGTSYAKEWESAKAHAARAAEAREVPAPVVAGAAAAGEAARELLPCAWCMGRKTVVIVDGASRTLADCPKCSASPAPCGDCAGFGKLKNAQGAVIDCRACKGSGKAALAR